jgi:hypothetical protein
MMKIAIYYTDFTTTPDYSNRGYESVARDFDENKLTYRLVWANGDRKLNFGSPDDSETLEAVFNYLNLQEPDGFAERFRSVSIGDVVCLDDRCYLCQTRDWRRLENFTPQI